MQICELTKYLKGSGGKEEKNIILETIWTKLNSFIFIGFLGPGSKTTWWVTKILGKLSVQGQTIQDISFTYLPFKLLYFIFKGNCNDKKTMELVPMSLEGQRPIFTAFFFLNTWVQKLENMLYKEKNYFQSQIFFTWIHQTVTFVVLCLTWQNVLLFEWNIIKSYIFLDPFVLCDSDAY